MAGQRLALIACWFAWPVEFESESVNVANCESFRDLLPIGPALVKATFGSIRSSKAEMLCG